MLRYVDRCRDCCLSAAPGFRPRNRAAARSQRPFEHLHHRRRRRLRSPDYEGSDDYQTDPGRGHPRADQRHRLLTRGTYLYVDVIRRPASSMDFDVGPIVGVRCNRSGEVKDDVVDLLPELDTAIEVGGFAGVSWHGLTNPYDTLVLARRRAARRRRRARIDRHQPRPSISARPCRAPTYVGASAGADWAGDGYADYYYSITPAECAGHRPARSSMPTAG